ncbi:Alpha/beta hydrolase [Sphingomonas antarctica]|uniref:alpha/beta fold hydrolase n=1 Tax=Sphingomonas antarctica TaxID=2040274 RepID=UPI0039EBC258
MIARLAAALLLVCAPAFAQTAPGKSYLTLGELRAKYANRASRYATIAGIDVHYKDEGHGPALLLVHGSSSTMRTWDAATRLLTARYRVIRYDVPGQGLSGDVSDQAAATVAPATIAEGLLARLKVTKVTVIGVSSGGTLGIQLAARRPDMVERLIISNAPSDPVDTSHMVLSPAWAKAQADAKASGFQNHMFWNEFLSYFAGDGRRIDAATRAGFVDFNRRSPNKNMIALTARVADHAKAVAADAAVRAPTLLIWGGSDKLLPASAGRTLRDYLTGTDAAVVYMPDVGHFPPIETPDRFVRIATAWIEAATPR